ncbi:MAG: GTP 3',8-cyclase MoaA [Rhodocyclaceae bacterium]|nr:GTP 3',8-cyclase MoaA [Rhodocyclaceae bacterium]
MAQTAVSPAPTSEKNASGTCGSRNPSPAIIDTLARPLHDLRISVTDRCNFRCPYCMPKTVFGRDYPFLARTELLSFEEIERVASAAVACGVRKLRITGGEPLLRKHLPRLIERLARLPVELTLTTNGVLLARNAQDLRNAGLNRVTVSLDALDDAIFRRMNDADARVTEVLAGIDAAAAAGLSPVKINCVAQRGVNDGEILPLAEHFRGTGHILRFIEYMDVGSSNGWRMDEVVTARDILERIGARHPLEAIEAAYPGEVAERWRYRDGSGEIGVIASVTQAFCRDCTRLRLSTDGTLYTCLFSSHGKDIRGLLRGGASDDELRSAIGAQWSARSDRYSELRQSGQPVIRKIEMSYIGG